MASIEYEIESLFDKLPYADQQEMITRLVAISKIKEDDADLPYLEDRWEEIEKLMAELDLERYIDDQVEIDEIWDICKEIVDDKSKLEVQSWEDRFTIICKIVDGYFSLTMASWIQ